MNKPREEYNQVVHTVDLQTVIRLYMEGLEIKPEMGEVISKETYVDTAKGKLVVIVNLVKRA